MVRKLFYSLILLSVSLFIFAPVIHAESGQAYEVGADILHVRDQPDHDAKIIGYLSYGDHLIGFQEKYGWVQTYFDGKEVWVASQFLMKDGQNAKINSDTPPANNPGTLDGYTIMLDPGHGGMDPGAIAINGEREKDLTLALSHSVAQKLRQAGATVQMTRTDDTYITLEDRVQMSNANPTDAFISLHYNAFFLNESNGVSTHYVTNGSDYQLAKEIQTALETNTSFNSRGVLQDDYHVLRKNKDLAVLVELGFITNPTDQANILSDNHHEIVATAITDGLVRYFEQ